MGEHTELNLRIVRGKNHVMNRIFRDKRGTNLFPFFRTDRNILQVRITARKATRRRSPLHKVRVDAMRFLVHERRENFHVSVLKLFQFAVIQNRLNKKCFLFRKVEFVQKAIENSAVRAAAGRRFLQDLELKIVVKNFGELLWRTDIERASTRKLVHEFFRFFDARRKVCGKRLQSLGVHGCAVFFHVKEHLENRHFRFFKMLQLPVLRKLFLDLVPEFINRRSGLCGIFRCIVHRHTAKFDFIFSILI